MVKLGHPAPVYTELVFLSFCYFLLLFLFFSISANKMKYI